MTPGELPLHDRTVDGVFRARVDSCPDRTFLRYEDEVRSYGQADSEVAKLAAGLAATGVGPGTHVAMAIGNRPEIVWLYLALARLGAVAVPLNTAARGSLLAAYLNATDATVLVAEAGSVDSYRAVRDQCRGLRQVIVLDDDDRDAHDGTGGGDVRAYGDLLRSAPLEEPAPVRFDDTFCLMLTSGTTGPSKANIWPHCVAVEYALARIEHLGYCADDVLYTALPLFHGNALFGACIPALVAGCTVAIASRFSARRFWDDIRRHGATKFNVLGAMSSILWRSPSSPCDGDHTARQATMVPVPEFAAGFEERFNLRVTSVYALTDFGLATVRGEGEPPDKLRSAGRARPGMEVTVVDEDDVPVGAGEVGEICVRNTEPWNAATGYYGMPDETLRSRRNLWFHTGDRGYEDADGYLYFVDRKKDAIRRRGENISSWEIEQILGRHPSVVEAAAFAVPSELGEDEVMVTIAVVPGADLTEAEVVEFSAENMAHFMVPRYVELVHDLPRTSAQKVEKARLRATAVDRLGDIWDRDQVGIEVNR